MSTEQTKSEQSPADQDVSAETVNGTLDQEELATASDTAEQVEENSVNDPAEELASAQATIKDYWDQIVRLKAEIENNRKRAQRDVENAHKFAVKNFVESLLPVTDSMELGLQAASNENTTLEAVVEGVRMTHDLFVKTLEKNSVSVIDPTGEKFNPEQHQAMTMQASAEHEPNTVLSVMQKGYLLNDRLIRPAMVVVSKTVENS